MIFDTDVFIWLLRGYPQAVERVRAESERSISIVTYLELLQGVRNKQEMTELRRLLVGTAWNILPLTEAIGQRAAVYMEEHVLGSGLQLADALIAATAVESGMPLTTGNEKHFGLVSDLDLRVYRHEP